MIAVRFIIAGPLAEHTAQCGYVSYGRACNLRDRLDAAHGERAHTVIAGVGDRHGWRRAEIDAHTGREVAP